MKSHLITLASLGLFITAIACAAPPLDVAICNNPDLSSAQRVTACDHAIFSMAGQMEGKFALQTSWAIAHADLNDYPNILLSLDAALAITPNDADLLSARALTLSRMKQYAKSLADADASIRIDPKGAFAYLVRANTHYSMKQYREAIEDDTQVLRREPDEISALTNRAYAYESLGLHALALADFDRLVQTNQQQDNADNYNGRCMERMILGRDLETALADCSQSLTLHPGDIYALNSRGLVNLKLKRYVAAINDFSAAIRNDPTEASNYFGRGLAKNYLKPHSGDRDLARARQVNPQVSDQMKKWGFRSKV